MGADYMKEMMEDFVAIMYSSVNKNISQVLDHIVFIQSDILEDGVVEKIFGKENNFGTIQIAYTFIYGILIYFLFRYLLSKITNEEIEDFSGLIYKIIISALVVGFSFEICKFIIQINSYITEEIFSFGENAIKQKINFKNLFRKVSIIISKTRNDEARTINSILQGFVSFGLINLILVYSLRYIYIKILCILMPFAIIFKSSRKTEYMTKAWIKSFFGLLFLQHIIAFIIVLALSIKYGRVSLLGKVMAVGCVYALMQINELQREIIGGSSLYINSALRAHKGGI